MVMACIEIPELCSLITPLPENGDPWFGILSLFFGHNRRGMPYHLIPLPSSGCIRGTNHYYHSIDIETQTLRAMCENCMSVEIKDAAKEFWRLTEIQEIKLLHMNCEGCEWEFFKKWIDTGILENVDIVQYSLHYLPLNQDIAVIKEKYCELHESLDKTHILEFGIPFGWQRWIKNKNSSKGFRHNCQEFVLQNLPINAAGNMKVHHDEAVTGKWNENDRWREFPFPLEGSAMYVGANTDGADGKRLLLDHPNLVLHVYEPVPLFFHELVNRWKQVPCRRAKLYNYGLGYNNRTVILNPTDVQGQSTFIMK
jgi:hypothetical protein